MKKTGLLILFFLSFHFVNAQFFKIPASQIEIDSSTIIPDGQDRLKVNTDVICSIDGLTNSLITRVQFNDTLTTIASRYKLNLKVDSIYKSHDSIFYCANGNCEFAFRDSSGSGGSQNLQSVTDVGNTTNDSIISTSVIKAALFYATERVVAVNELKSNGDLNVDGVAVVDGDVLCGSNVEVNGGVEILGAAQFYGDIFANSLPLSTPQILQVDGNDKVIGTNIDPSDLLLKSGNLSGLTNAGTSRTNLGGTTVGQNLFTLTNPSAITFPRINADNSVSALSASFFRTAIGAGTGAGDALTSNSLSQFASTTSLELKNTISDETGSGALVFATSPALITPALGVATATTINGATITSGTLNGSVTGTNTGDQTITLTGDITGSGTGSFAATLATVNSNVGTFGSATQTPVFVVNGKGLITSASNTTIQIAESQVTNLATDLSGKVSTGTTVNGKALSSNITLGLASSDFSNQGTTTTVLHGNASGNPSFGQIVTADITNDAVTYAKIQNVSATDKILGRSTTGAGDIEEITCTQSGRDLIDDANASAQRTTLGLGTSATQNITAFVQILGKSSTNSSITGTVNETVLGALLISANTVSVGEQIEIRPRFTKTGTAGSWTPRIRIHTSNAVAGNIIYAQSGVAASNFAALDKVAYIKTSSSTTVGSTSTMNDNASFITTSNPEVSYTIDWTVDQYIIFTIALGNTGDTGVLSGYIVTLY
jgi:hypothetical protein